MLRFLESLQFVLFIFFTAAYAYQFVYLAVGLFGKGKQVRQDAKLHRYAAIISARNEEGVIGDLVKSLKAQNYPAHLLDVFVVADNCTDSTAAVARKAGATVYERFNKVQVGKGYAMDWLFHRIFEDKGEQTYDAFLVFDADNLVDPNFVREMNKMFDTGEYAALTSYRNSKNFCDNWISAGYALWFLREARFLNRPRTQLGVNCAVSGTGFLIAGDVIREDGGWPYHLLTEDIEFSIACAVRGRKIGYCGTAVVYDEQPVQFRQSWDQRMRWSKGFYQVDAKYGARLVKGFCQKPTRKSWSCYDMFMTVAPGMLLTLVTIAFNLVMCFACLGQPMYIIRGIFDVAGSFLVSTVCSFYLGLLLYGLLTVLCEWKQIQIPNYKKILYVFTFPIFMFTYIPISLAALVQKVEWKPIYHTGSQKTLGKAA